MRLPASLVVILALTAFTLPAAAASVTGQIFINGYAEPANSAFMGTATGLNFASGSSPSFMGNSGSLYNFGAGSGSFSGFTCSSSGACGTIMDIGSFATEPATTGFLTFVSGGRSISFDLTSISSVVNNTSGDSVTFTALGTIDLSGDDPTAGSLTLTSQGNNTASFSAALMATPPAAAATTPEPSSLLLIAGPMLCGVAQQLRRKQRTRS